MSLPSVNGSIGLPASQPDYGRALALRSIAAAYTELPRYLLAPEVTGLLHHLPDWTQHALVNSLWNTGGRLNEVLVLRRRDFRLNDTIPHVIIRATKQRMPQMRLLPQPAKAIFLDHRSPAVNDIRHPSPIHHHLTY